MRQEAKLKIQNTISVFSELVSCFPLPQISSRVPAIPHLTSSVSPSFAPQAPSLRGPAYCHNNPRKEGQTMAAEDWIHQSTMGSNSHHGFPSLTHFPKCPAVLSGTTTQRNHCMHFLSGVYFHGNSTNTAGL